MRKGLALLLTVASLASLALAVRQGVLTHRDRDYYPKRAMIVEKTEHPDRLRLGYLDRRGLPHQAQAPVSRPDWERYEAGNLVDVYVPTSDPDRAWLQTDGDPSYRSAVLLALLGLALGGGAGLVGLLAGGDPGHTPD